LTCFGAFCAQPQADAIIIQTTKVLHSPDLLVLEYARAQDRILLSHDLKTMPHHFAIFLMDLPPEEHSPGIMLLPWNTPVGAAIQWLVEIWEASRHEEWRDLCTYLPI
jgi:hypothetical protein